MAGTAETDERARARTLAREIGAAPGDVDTVATLLELGVRPDAMRRALARGRLEDAIFDAVLDPERALVSETVDLFRLVGPRRQV
jgi:hypothetical protein